MDNIKTDAYYITKMLKYINMIESYLSKMEKLGIKLTKNEPYSDGVTYKLIQLREEAKNLSYRVLDKYPLLAKELKFITSFRNQLTHDYDNVKYTFFEEILEYDIPKLKRLLEDALDEEAFLDKQKKKKK